MDFVGDPISAIDLTPSQPHWAVLKGALLSRIALGTRLTDGFTVEYYTRTQIPEQGNGLELFEAIYVSLRIDK